MSFLAIYSKDGTGTIVDEAKLNTMLSPYRGNLSKIQARHFVIFHTELWVKKNVGSIFLAIKESSSITPGGKIEIEDEGLMIQSDDMGMMSLWLYESERYWAVSNEAKAFSILPNFQFEFVDDRVITSSTNHDPAFSPFRNITNVSSSKLIFSQIDESSSLTFSTSQRSYLSIKEGETSDTHEQRILGYLRRSAASLPSIEKMSASLSGGIDSAISTALVRKEVEQLNAITLSTSLGSEKTKAEKIADALGTTLYEYLCSDQELVDAFERTIFENEIFDGMSAEIVAQMSTLLNSPKIHPHLITGYGSDLLFGGMLGSQLYLDAVGTDSTEGLIERTRWTGELRPQVFWHKGIQPHHLFWSRDLIEYSTSISAEFQKNETYENKALLRQSAATHGILPKPLTMNKKLGMTLGTQAHKIINSYLGLTDEFDYTAKTTYCWKTLKRKLKDLCK